MSNKLPDMPTFLVRKDNPIPPATADERAAFAAKTVVVETPSAPDPAVEHIEADEARKKKAKQSNRIARLAAQQSRRDIPDKYLGWDTKHCRFYDTRKGKPKSAKENVMTAKKKSNGKATKKVVTRFKKSATPKAAKTSKAASAKPARSGSKREKIIAMLKRDNGASLAELLKANPLGGKTPLNTIAAMVSVLGKSHTVERVGDGKGESRRFRIV